MPELPDSSREQYGSSPAANSQSRFQSQQNYYPQQSGLPSSTQPNLTHGQGSGRPSPLNMGSFVGALPEINYGQGYPQQSPQNFQTAAPGSLLAYQLQQLSQYPGQLGSAQSSSPAYNTQFPQQFQAMYTPNQGPNAQISQSRQPAGQQFYSSQGFSHQQRQQAQQQQQVQQFLYQQGPQFPGQNQMFAGSSLQSQYGNRMAAQADAKQPNRQRSNEQLSARSGIGIAKAEGAGSSVSKSSLIRGPPRKPKQSGHALWVGNLPPGANVVDLKDHFSRDATDAILSVFLISKSNCAFVNYKTEEACTAAMGRFHDSSFGGARLVCRLRRSTVNAVPGVPTGPAALTTAQPPISRTPVPDAQPQEDKVEDEAKDKGTTSEKSQAKEKFFIVKSLTVEDLEMSVHTGIWATQSHNEEALNKAYKTADTVYLIFSANKSGEYFGYAKMTSPINNDPQAAIAFAPQTPALSSPSQPRATATPATASAPRGRIIDDSARGTIFWEAETGGLDSAEDQIASDADADNEGPAWGKPFRLEWLSTSRLPFHRTRGLRNPWNADREVKIARDGTELETGVGRRLVGMFRREGGPADAGQLMMVGAGGFVPARTG